MLPVHTPDWRCDATAAVPLQNLGKSQQRHAASAWSDCIASNHAPCLSYMDNWHQPGAAILAMYA